MAKDHEWNDIIDLYNELISVSANGNIIVKLYIYAEISGKLKLNTIDERVKACEQVYDRFMTSKYEKHIKKLVLEYGYETGCIQ